MIRPTEDCCAILTTETPNTSRQRFGAFLDNVAYPCFASQIQHGQIPTWVDHGLGSCIYASFPILILTCGMQEQFLYWGICNPLARRSGVNGTISKISMKRMRILHLLPNPIQTLRTMTWLAAYQLSGRHGSVTPAPQALHCFRFSPNAETKLLVSVQSLRINYSGKVTFAAATKGIMPLLTLLSNIHQVR